MTALYGDLIGLESRDVPYEYTERDTLLYAVSIGMGRNPTDEQELRYVYENYRLRVVPSQAIVVARQKLIWDIGLDVGKFLHGEQKLTIHRPLPIAASLLADARVVEVYDKGPAKGSIIELAGTVRDRSDEKPLFSWSSLIIARGDGGIGGSTRKAPSPHLMPQRIPDMSHIAETRPDQALLYRLNGDRNLVHVDPVVAKRAGLERPILHGACTYAIACREILAHTCNYDHTRMRTLDARFTAPVYPGENVQTDIWVDGDTIAFRCRSLPRNVVVIDHGRCTVGESLLEKNGAYIRSKNPQVALSSERFK